MKAMILAAGRGERMRPLTDVLPKPMLTVQSVPLIVHHLLKLQKVGITDIVINLAWLGEKIVEHLQDGARFGVNITYSWEKEGALETAGGIINALPLLSDNDQPFLVVNGDIYVDYDFSNIKPLAQDQLAHLWLVDNPGHHLAGDFVLQHGMLKNLAEQSATEQSLTFSGIGLYRPSLFNDFLQQKVMALAPVLRAGIEQNAISGERLSGLWSDVGTPERLSAINELLAQNTRTKV